MLKAMHWSIKVVHGKTLEKLPNKSWHWFINNYVSFWPFILITILKDRLETQSAGNCLGAISWMLDYQKAKYPSGLRTTFSPPMSKSVLALLLVVVLQEVAASTHCLWSALLGCPGDVLASQHFSVLAKCRLGAYEGTTPIPLAATVSSSSLRQEFNICTGNSKNHDNFYYFLCW